MRQEGWTCRYVLEAGKTSTLKDPLKEALGRLLVNGMAGWNRIDFNETTKKHERENVQFFLFRDTILSVQ